MWPPQNFLLHALTNILNILTKRKALAEWKINHCNKNAVQFSKKSYREKICEWTTLLQTQKEIMPFDN